MDKKNLIVGLVCMSAAFGLMVWESKQQPSVDKKVTQESTTSVSSEGNAITNNKLTDQLSKEEALSVSVTEDKPEPLKVSAARAKEEFFVLENDYITVTFTSNGGAIKSVSMKKYPAVLGKKDPYVFNGNAPLPALALGFPDGKGNPLEYAPTYKLVTLTNNTIRFAYETPEGIRIIRGYALSTSKKEDPYVIEHEICFINQGKKDLNLKKIFLNVGAFARTEGDTLAEYLNFGYYDGKEANFVKTNDFHAGNGFFGMGKHDAISLLHKDVPNLLWVSAKNQCFAAVLTLKDEVGSGIFSKTIQFPYAPELSEGIMGGLELSLGNIAAQDKKLLNMQYYVGPKEYTRLEKLGQRQDLVMQFGFFGFISKFLLIMMIGVQSLIQNWGVTIIIVTVVIKLFLWPLTAAQVKSSKRMALIQKPLQELKEKYKGNPQKIQAETLKLFKEHKVNPAAGCLPLLVQIPIFLGLYFMLRTSSELRFAPFLWIKDLSVADTVGSIAGFPINVLPLLMGVTMFFQMKLTPTPTTDNVQQKILQFMPFIFLIFCYKFPAGLVLYWTVQNLLTILQQFITNKQKEAVVTVTEPASLKKNFKKKA
ncbi:MAG: hypothetical protein A2007_03410 [Verrucomicrobia bacterium GWC2_42_7]|nr:MAG: hypothetical protein A2007_03410 [Verrucomicrobia bacterium GWC2_42_7]